MECSSSQPLDLQLQAHQEIQDACFWAELVGLALEALEARCGTVTGVKRLPRQDVLPGTLIHGVVYGDHLGHVILTGGPALQAATRVREHVARLVGMRWQYSTAGSPLSDCNQQARVHLLHGHLRAEGQATPACQVMWVHHITSGCCCQGITYLSLHRIEKLLLRWVHPYFCCMALLMFGHIISSHGYT